MSEWLYGQMTDPHSSIETLFTVHEFMSGGSLDSRLWHQPLDSVTWRERLTWACDVAEGMEHIHHRGGGVDSNAVPV